MGPRPSREAAATCRRWPASPGRPQPPPRSGRDRGTPHPPGAAVQRGPRVPPLGSPSLAGPQPGKAAGRAGASPPSWARGGRGGAGPRGERSGGKAEAERAREVAAAWGHRAPLPNMVAAHAAHSSSSAEWIACLDKR